MPSSKKNSKVSLAFYCRICVPKANCHLPYLIFLSIGWLGFGTTGQSIPFRISPKFLLQAIYQLELSPEAS